MSEPIKVFVQGMQEPEPGRDYLRFKQFSVGVITDGVLVVLRKDLMIDVTDEEIMASSTQQEVDAWCGTNSARLERSMSALFNQYSRTEEAKSEARAQLKAMRASTDRGFHR